MINLPQKWHKHTQKNSFRLFLQTLLPVLQKVMKYRNGKSLNNITLLLLRVLLRGYSCHLKSQVITNALDKNSRKHRQPRIGINYEPILLNY